MLQPNFFNTVFVFPILNVLVFLYKIFLFLKIPGAFGLAIVSLTIFVRLAFQPFFKQQLEIARKMQELKPHLDRLSKKHKDDKKRLQEEQMKLYRRAGINPGFGCLFIMIQFPIFFALYKTLSLFLFNGNTSKIISQINNVLYTPLLKIQSIEPWFFGFNLAVSPDKAGSQWYYLFVPLITAVLQYLQTQFSSQTGSKAPQTDTTEKTKSSLENDDDFQKLMNAQMKLIFPLMIGWFSYKLPVGLSLYWNIFSIFSIIQYRKLKIKS